MMPKTPERGAAKATTARATTRPPVAQRLIARDDFAPFVQALMDGYNVVAPQRKENQFSFQPLRRAEDLCMDYVRTVLPPRKYLQPPKEELLHFATAPEVEVQQVLGAEPLLLLGVHPCDIAGIWLCDKVFADNGADPNYMARRRQTLIVGTDCLPDEHCFCTGMGTNVPEQGYDLFLTAVERGYVAEVGSEAGSRLLEERARTQDVKTEDVDGVEAHRQKKTEAMKRDLHAEVAGLPLLLERVWDSKVWDEDADPCFSCGSCVLVCPTCVCFDVFDVVNLDLKSGVRMRRWDGCHLPDFALVAGGHNFRPSRVERLRHRFNRKFRYLMTRYGAPYCTGCGRCGFACLVHINIVDTLNHLTAASR
jgi:NAD-dependent dihydropyrimidine dehydrogenase PreA subunit